MTEEKKILFYGQKNEYREFSNFYPAPIVIDSVTWPATEHYFQAMKFPHDAAYMEKIRNDANPATAKSYGGNRSKKMRLDWEQVKESFMKIALRAKFTQHRQLKKLLLDTKNAFLEENTDRDTYWANGGINGKGKNRLGHLLMELRTELLHESS